MSSTRADTAARGPYCAMSELLRERFAARDLKLFSPRPAQSVQSGRFRTRFRGRGVDFEEVRLYQAGDDIRSIDWRVTARTQTPHTKLYSEERERPVYIVCDQRSPMFFGSVNCFKSTLACHIGALLGWAALHSGDRVGTLVFGDSDFRDARPKRSKHSVLQLLQFLESYNHALQSPIASTGGLSLAQICKDLRRIATPGAAVFIISDLHDLDDEAEKQLFHLQRHLDITLIHLSDPLEQQLRAHGPLTITDGASRVQLPAQDTQFQRAYEARAAEHLAQLQARAQRLGLERLALSTADSHTQLLRQRFGGARRGGRQ
ncbi:DUF58 domain-containing protein [Gilvimarinus algae]|uniref:DUF58 domain-containing protein n=1 Tax=Gilvimarinus algae TaxID=3058037 RepID=A0ABT8TDQ3_9GAMM|nr:DUF58 domain-containing protein [Gilvimarinus sp. SDUM040014]MDO3382205.1 DUF58 domain-containing protein [Gilvimarinus sp. SDUM040014]